MKLPIKTSKKKINKLKIISGIFWQYLAEWENHNFIYYSEKHTASKLTEWIMFLEGLTPSFTCEKEFLAYLRDILKLKHIKYGRFEHTFGA